MTEPENNFDNKNQITWCPGCGNFSIIAALKNALKTLNYKPHDIVLAGDIGCSSKLTDYVEVNTFTGLHGRVIPLAQGIKLANHKLHVIAIGGDGGLFAEGGNHILHAARRNINITVIVNDNQVYALTKGQASPTSEKKFISGPTPEGTIENPINPLLVALASGATFIARGWAGDNTGLSEIFAQAISHDGFSIVDVLSPCVSFNKINTLEYYKSRVYKLVDDATYDKSDLTQAFEKVRLWGDHIPIGVIHEASGPTYEKQIPVLQKGTLVSQNNGLIDTEKLLDR
ncbi:MAG: 2-oxoacid:ferredoxin oxidoreductase subunit beta [bacterium]|nr:2-oxoacid:ferredoxin oxidoreductase subunit beta [bacterium]